MLESRLAWIARYAWAARAREEAALGLGFGLFDRVSPLTALALALGVLAIEIPFSVWWLSDHPYGPVEWLGRRVSYGAVPAGRTAQDQGHKRRRETTPGERRLVNHAWKQRLGSTIKPRLVNGAGERR